MQKKPSRAPVRPAPPLPPAELKSGKRNPWWAYAALCSIAFAAYANALSAGLALDAPVVIQNDTRIRDVSLENLQQIVTHEYWWPSFQAIGLYRPLTTASFLFNYAILGNGDSPAGYHWLNLLLHLVNVLLVYALARRLLAGLWPAIFAAALWAVHPIGTESVTNVAGRSDLLSTAAVVGGLLLYIRITEQEKRNAGMLVGLFGLAMAAMFSKESGAVMVGLMLLWDLAFDADLRKAEWIRRVPSYCAVLLPLALLLCARHQVFNRLPVVTFPVVDNPLVSAGFVTAKLTALKVIGLYLWLLVCPMNLSCDRSFHQIALSGPGDLAMWLAMLAVAAILGIAFLRFRKDPLWFWAAGFFGIALLPTSNLLFPIGSIMAERFLYLPSIAFAIAVSALAFRFGNRRWMQIALAAVLLLLALRTHARNQSWQSDFTLLSDDVRTVPNSFKMHESLGSILVNRDAQRNIDRAIQEHEAAWEILRSLPDADIPQESAANLGGDYLMKGNLTGGVGTEEGRRWLTKAVETLERARAISIAGEKAYDQTQISHGKPLVERHGFANIFLNLGAAYSSVGRDRDAIQAYREGRNLAPFDGRFYDRLSKLYRSAGDLSNSALMLDETALLDRYSPNTVAAIREIYLNIPDGACAVQAGASSLSLTPSCPRLRTDMCRAGSDLGHTFQAWRRPERAAELKREVIQRFGCSASELE